MFHEPVMPGEAVELLIKDPQGTYLDGTLGGGGHAQAILERLEKNGRLIGIDKDQEALDFASKRLEPFSQQLITRQGDFKDAERILSDIGCDTVDGVLLDLGISSHQIDSAPRGFSFDRDASLDMRMDSREKITAHEIINTWDESKLAGIIKKYGEEKRHRAIARTIVWERRRNPIDRTTQLRDVICRVIHGQYQIKSVARVFQAIRIAVNGELENLIEFLLKSFTILNPGGRFVIISYHSLEDRIVKQFFKKEALGCTCPPEVPICICGKQSRLRILTRRPIVASEAEVRSNSRARSAKLRAAEMISK